MRKIIPLFLFVLICTFVVAQQPSDPNSTVDVQALIVRIQQLEKRVAELENQHTQTPTVAANALASSTTASTAPAISIAEAQQDAALKETIEKDGGLKIRGFGQATFIADDLKGDRPTLNAGNLTLLMTSKLSDKLSAIGEIALDEEGYGSPEFKAVLERAVLQYEHNEHLKFTAGRYFSSIGYYNTAFYNADWAQTTMRRPIIASFQDEGGLAPMQRNGLSISGRLTSGKLGLHYVAEVGSGDVTRADALGLGYEFPIQARTGFNFALYAKPSAIEGLQAGGSFFHDSELPFITGVGDQLVRQNIYSAYAVFHNNKWEFLNEGYLLQHDVKGYRKFNVPAFYTQLSYRVAPAWRPYLRFTYLNGPTNDPMLPDLNGRQYGLEMGARYNFSEWVGLKFEYDRMHIESLNKDINLGGTQLVFTF